jgi:UDP-N-acetylglucosamine 2-epimerase (non-hydrolysing)
MKKVLIIFGTRPEAIKMAPLIKEFKKHPKFFETKICVTAQHREMLDQVLTFFKILPDFDLNIMKPDQNLHTLTSNIIEFLKPILDSFMPDFVFVHGDTTTSMASSIASFYSGAKVCHIEAGLRTNCKSSPFPEEINRQIISRICDYHFAPTEISKSNLIRENISEDTIIVTGNTVIDALLSSINKIKKNPSKIIKELSKRIGTKEVLLITGHRRENHGQGFENICEAIKIIAKEKNEILIIYPVHPNPKVQEPVKRLLSNIKNVLLIDPLTYQDFVWLMNRSKIIITDSGGIQEEAPSLGKPVLVTRVNTERPEAVEAGTVILIGTSIDLIVSKTLEILNCNDQFYKMININNPYGDGMASKRIVKYIKNVSNRNHH